ncbi:hypothetical protein cypCar_00002908 [Cyprinus carpio]|nr:hypothetical protein cypCar_00002908 [Cyprinus carpio]
MLVMWCSRTALGRLQRIAPCTVTGFNRAMSTLPKVFVTRKVPPEGLDILRKSGHQYNFVLGVYGLLLICKSLNCSLFKSFSHSLKD